MLKCAVFVSGRGSNLAALIQFQSTKSELFKVELVVSDKLECGAFELARAESIKTISVSAKERDSYLSYDELLDVLTQRGIGLIVLAGFLKKIPDRLIDAYPNKIINIHPALLPSFGGKGMYGLNVHQAVFDKSCKVSGATVHFVDKIYDNGLIIDQRCVDISKANSPQEISELVLRVEHDLLPSVVGKIAEGKVKEVNSRIVIE